MFINIQTYIDENGRTFLSVKNLESGEVINKLADDQINEAKQINQARNLMKQSLS
jgi:hypothetical protein